MSLCMRLDRLLGCFTVVACALQATARAQQRTGSTKNPTHSCMSGFLDGWVSFALFSLHGGSNSTSASKMADHVQGDS